MTAKVKVVKDNSKKALEALSGNNLGRAVMAGAFHLESAVKISMSAASHSGKVYGRHQASAPGETPSVHFANLVNSISSTLVESTTTTARSNVSVGADYGVHLEFGTSKMEKRPFMRPAFDENLEKIKAIVQRFAKQNLEGVG